MEQPQKWIRLETTAEMMKRDAPWLSHSAVCYCGGVFQRFIHAEKLLKKNKAGGWEQNHRSLCAGSWRKHVSQQTDAALSTGQMGSLLSCSLSLHLFLMFIPKKWLALDLPTGPIWNGLTGAVHPSTSKIFCTYCMLFDAWSVNIWWFSKILSWLFLMLALWPAIYPSNPHLAYLCF